MRLLGKIPTWSKSRLITKVLNFKGQTLRNEGNELRMTTAFRWLRTCVWRRLGVCQVPAKQYLQFISQTSGMAAPSWINSHFRRVIGNNQKLEGNGTKLLLKNMKKGKNKVRIVRSPAEFSYKGN